MGEPEGEIDRRYTTAQIAAKLMEIAPNVQGCVMLAMTKGGDLIMMRTPMGFGVQAMVTALVNHDMNRTTERYMDATKQGRSN